MHKWTEHAFLQLNPVSKNLMRWGSLFSLLVFCGSFFANKTQTLAQIALKQQFAETGVMLFFLFVTGGLLLDAAAGRMGRK